MDASQPGKNVAAPLTAATMIAQQVAANAMRDALFLTWFPVTSLPLFVGSSAILSLPAVEGSGRLLARFGPTRVVPAMLGLNGVLFLAEWILLADQPRAAAVLLYLHSSVLGAIAISGFWSLLNERFDPHAAKPLMARVAGAAAFGGLAGGIGAERVAALLPEGALLLVLALVGGVCATGAVMVGGAAPAPQRHGDVQRGPSGWTEISRVPLLRDLAFVVALAAALAAFVDYVFKAEAVAYFGRGEHLVRFFGLFYAGTGLAAFLLQATVGRVVLRRLGLGGAVASHAAAVGAAAVLGFVVPGPWRGICSRGLDVAVRGSVFRAGYELFYTPLPDATKRSAKSVIDVAADCFGKGAGSAVLLVLTTLVPRYAIAAANVASVLAAGMELLVARRLRSGYVNALEGGLRRQGEDLERAAQYSMSNFTVVQSMAGLDRVSLLLALGQAAKPASAVHVDDPVVAAVLDLRSGDLARIRAALRALPQDPVVIAALIPLLAEKAVLRDVVGALKGFGVRCAGQLVDALLDPATPDTVRRRLPLVLKSSASPLARDGLVHALGLPSLEVRKRSARALLALTDEHPELTLPPHAALSAVERELAGAGDDAAVREHVVNLLALALEREPVRITAMAFDTDDRYLRGTALEYLETVLPASIFAALAPRLSATAAPVVHRRGAAAVRADLLDAAATITMNRDRMRSQLAISGVDEEG